MNGLLGPRVSPSFSPSCRLYPPGRSPLRDGVEPEAWRPRVFLRQAQDKLTLRRTAQVRLGFDFGFRISDLGFLTALMTWNLIVKILLLVF